MEMSTDIKDLATAFSKAQATVEGAAKDSSNPHFKNNYADLGSVWSACREALTKNGLSVVQFPGELVENRMTMTTMLMHSSGQWMRETLSIPLSKVDAQGYGSATTYARRYALAAVVGVCPEDDDGNAASQGNGGRQNGTQQQAPAGKITAQQAVELEILANDVGANIPAFLEYIKADSLQNIKAANLDQARRALEAKRQKKAA